MAYCSFAVGDIFWEDDNYCAGLGATVDLRWNYVRMGYKQKSFKQEMAIFSLIGNAMIIRRFSENFYNLFSVHYGPTFTNRQNTPIDGYVFFLKNSFSYGFGKLGLSISPELRSYRTKDIHDDLWKSNTILVHFGFSIRV